MKRTTIELDETLIDRAKRALGARTTRETVEEALRRAAEAGEAEMAERRTVQAAYLSELHQYADLAVMGSEEMWR